MSLDKVCALLSSHIVTLNMDNYRNRDDDDDEDDDIDIDGSAVYDAVENFLLPRVKPIILNNTDFKKKYGNGFANEETLKRLAKAAIKKCVSDHVDKLNDLQAGGKGRRRRPKPAKKKKKKPTTATSKWVSTGRRRVTKQGVEKTLYRSTATGELRVRKCYVSSDGSRKYKYVPYA